MLAENGRNLAVVIATVCGLALAHLCSSEVAKLKWFCFDQALKLALYT